MGDIVAVRDGYARNFLIPKGKALRATEQARQGFETRRKQLEARNLELRGEAEQVAGNIQGASVVILRQASESAQLYGSVTARDIADAFAAEGITFTRQQVRIDQPLKELGIHDVAVALHPEVEVIVKVNVARSAEEADIQAGKAQPKAPDEEEEPQAEEDPFAGL
jgi:large subunit ribosomal protein L9